MVVWFFITGGSLEVKLPTIYIDGKAEVGRVREEKRRRKIREEKEPEETRSRCAKEYIYKIYIYIEKSRNAVFLWLQRLER